MTVLVVVLLASTAIALGLRTSSLFLDERVHPMVRLGVAIVAGTLISAVVLEVCASYKVIDLGLGLLLSLSPVGPYDLAKWWFRWRRP
jgi:hypothetical protein